MTKAKVVVSASRRTDLPRFYYTWLQQVLGTGVVELANPRFPEKRYSVDLRPDKVHSLVLWSKDFSEILAAPGHLTDYNLYFQYTINNYSKLLEPQVPDYRQSIRVLDGLLQNHRPEQFNIRFDPIIISRLGENSPTADEPEKARLTAFMGLCRDIVALGMKSCRITTSYLALYGHVRNRLTRSGVDWIPLARESQVRFFTMMAEIADRYDLMLCACACPALDNVPKLNSGRCVDGYLLESLFGGKVSKARDQGQRKACNCHKSVDIGDYNQKCPGGCSYCYALPY